MRLNVMYLLFTGSYFCYDNPGALQDNFIDDMKISTAQFAQLYSWYSWPNVVLCFVGGFLLDRYATGESATSLSTTDNGKLI